MSWFERFVLLCLVWSSSEGASADTQRSHLTWQHPAFKSDSREKPKVFHYPAGSAKTAVVCNANLKYFYCNVADFKTPNEAILILLQILQWCISKAFMQLIKFLKIQYNHCNISIRNTLYTHTEYYNYTIGVGYVNKYQLKSLFSSINVL